VLVLLLCVMYVFALWCVTDSVVDVAACVVDIVGCVGFDGDGVIVVGVYRGSVVVSSVVVDAVGVVAYDLVVVDVGGFGGVGCVGVVAAGVDRCVGGDRVAVGIVGVVIGIVGVVI